MEDLSISIVTGDCSKPQFSTTSFYPSLEKNKTSEGSWKTFARFCLFSITIRC